MIWLVVFALFLMAICVGGLFLSADTTAKALVFSRREHDDCHQHTTEVAEAVATVIGRAVLRAAADKWDSVEEQMNLKTLAREEYNPDGPSLPAIWLRKLADEMDLTL